MTIKLQNNRVIEYPGYFLEIILLVFILFPIILLLGLIDGISQTSAVIFGMFLLGIIMGYIYINSRMLINHYIIFIIISIIGILGLSLIFIIYNNLQISILSLVIMELLIYCCFLMIIYYFGFIIGKRIPNAKLDVKYLWSNKKDHYKIVVGLLLMLSLILSIYLISYYMPEFSGYVFLISLLSFLGLYIIYRRNNAFPNILLFNKILHRKRDINQSDEPK